MSTITIIEGPAGCGKTSNKDALKKHFGSTRIIEEYQLHKRFELKPGDLILTTGRLKVPKTDIPTAAVKWSWVLENVEGLRPGAKAWAAANPQPRTS